jgi:hypothetical protein
MIPFSNSQQYQVFLIHYPWSWFLSFFIHAIPIVVVRRFGAREIAPQGQEVESASTS